ncbi:MAG: FapA family protein, partial [Spirochaetales bacterium]
NVRLDERGIVTVEPVVVVQNVNYETGNIRYNGSVIVEGSVADGFVVEAGGDLQIGKGVGKARLRSGRNLVIKTGINGKNEGYLECGGDLYARFLESCTAHVEGHIFVEEAIMHSEVTSGGNCVFSGKRAEIIGGRVIAGGSIWCRKMGNVNEVGTRAAIGVPPRVLLAYYEARRALSEAEDRVDNAEEALSKLDKAVEEGKRDERIERARKQLKTELPSLREARRRLRQEVPDRREKLVPDRNAILVAEELLFPGTVVTIGTHEYRPSGAGSYKTILHMGTSSIVETGLDPYSPPTLTFDTTDGAAEDR